MNNISCWAMKMSKLNVAIIVVGNYRSGKSPICSYLLASWLKPSHKYISMKFMLLFVKASHKIQITPVVLLIG